MLLRDLGRASPLLIAAAVAALALVGLLSLTPRIRQLLRERRARAADRLAEDKASVPAGGT